MTIHNNETALTSSFKSSLAHVLWIGGATDAGKSSVADVIAQRHGFQVYHYDRHEPNHEKRLAPISARFREIENMTVDTATMDAWWVHPGPEQLVQRSLCSFQNRFLLALEDLIAMQDDSLIVAEGFGFTPELLVSLLSSVHQALWFVSTEEFKWASMKRRNKPSFREIVSDPERATQNLFKRDMLLAEHAKEQAEEHGLQVFTVDGTRSIDEMADLAEQHFAPYVQGLSIQTK